MILNADGKPFKTEGRSDIIAARAAALKADMEANFFNDGEADRLRAFRGVFGLPQEPFSGLAEFVGAV